LPPYNTRLSLTQESDAECALYGHVPLTKFLEFRALVKLPFEYVYGVMQI